MLRSGQFQVVLVVQMDASLPHLQISSDCMCLYWQVCTGSLVLQTWHRWLLCLWWWMVHTRSIIGVHIDTWCKESLLHLYHVVVCGYSKCMYNYVSHIYMHTRSQESYTIKVQGLSLYMYVAQICEMEGTFKFGCIFLVPHTVLLVLTVHSICDSRISRQESCI